MKILSKQTAAFSLFSLIGFGANPLPIFAIFLLIGKLINRQTFIAEVKISVKSLWNQKKYRNFIIELVSLMLMAVFMSPNFLFSLKAFFVIIGMYFLGIVLLTTTYVNDKTLKAISLGLLIGLLIFASNSLFNFFPAKNKAIFAILPLIYALFHRRAEIFKNKQLSIFYFLASYILVGIILFKSQYGSATTKISYIASPIVFIFFYNFPIKWLKKFLTLTLFASIAAVVMSVYLLDSQKILSKFPNLALSFKHRICILEASMGLIKQKPLDGNGLKASRFYTSEDICYNVEKAELVANRIIEQDADGDFSFSFYKKPYHHQHNFIIQILFEFGVFGLIAFVLFLHRMIKDGDFSRKESNAFNLTLIFIIFNCYIFAYSLWEFCVFISFVAAKLISKRVNKI